MTNGKCPNCAATTSDPSARACAYCGVAFPHDEKRPRTRSEELSYEINGLCFSTIVLMVIAGVLWQIGWGRIAAVVALTWLAVLAAYSLHLYRKFGKKS